MTENWQMIIAAAAGLGLGAFFYGGLYFTVIRGLHASNPALWFLCSILLRMSVLMLGLYWIGDGQWQRILACLAGVAVAGIGFQVWKHKQDPVDLKHKAKIETETNAIEKAPHAP